METGQQRYHIINVLTRTYAALLEDTDRVAVVNIVLNLTEKADHGSEVKIISLTVPRGLTTLQWHISHREQDNYEIRNVHLERSRAGFDNRPEAADPVLGKWSESGVIWRIRPMRERNIYTLVTPTRSTT